MQSALTARRSLFLAAIAILSAVGILLSAVALYSHYATSKSDYCDFGANFNCDIVNRSIYSTVLGVPVALIGVLGYCGLLVLSIIAHRRKNTTGILILSMASALGLGFGVYLTYIEKFVLAVWCILCLSSLGVIFAINVISGLLMLDSKFVRTSERVL